MQAALASLNEIGAAINRLTPSEHADVGAVLQRIVESVPHFVPGAAAAIATYDAVEQAFDAASLVAAGPFPDMDVIDPPRQDGIGMRALVQRRRVLSTEEPDVALPPALVGMGVQVRVCFPLVVASQPVGVFYVMLREARSFDPLELLMIDTLAHHAAMAIYHTRRLGHAQQELAHTEAGLNRLWRAGMLISSQLGLDETLEAILEMALDVTGAHHGIFRLTDGDGTHLVTRAIAGAEGRPQVGALPVDSTSIMGWVAAHRQPLCIHDLAAAPWVRLYHPLDEDLRMRSELAVPLVGSNGRLEGVLNLESPVIGAFGDDDRHLLQSLATQAVIAIQEARLLDTLLEVARMLLIEPYQKVLQYLVAEAPLLLNAAASAIWVLDGEDLVLQATTTGPWRGDRLPLHGSLTGHAVLARTPVISEDVRRDPRFHRTDLARQQAWNRALIFPLLSSDSDEALGAFSVYDKQGEPGRFTESEWDRKVLTCLAYYATLALQNADRQRALRAAQERHAVAETFAAVGDVAANVLHHLNNKVGTIPVRVQGIQDKCAPVLTDDAYLAANLSEIERSAREAMDAVRDSLAYLRPIHAAPVTVAGCVEAALAAARLPDALKVEVMGLRELPAVAASRYSLVFVFTNLLENAAAALDGEGTVRVRGVALAHAVEVCVEDDGPGIPSELHERIFEFGPSDDHPRRSGKLGFGLWWVKTLLMRLGGTVAVESDGVRGTTFRLRLPRVEMGHA